ncbi:hypothetical protein [Streptomyces sp. SPB4]|nr:hypothetical protein [Streptomyces sp. SPB4]MDH6538061.1 hypothetical protein [Streptomyces sp. SPB4]
MKQQVKHHPGLPATDLLQHPLDRVDQAIVAGERLGHSIKRRL